LQNITDEIIIFSKNAPGTDLPNGDYKEFLELVIIFLGGEKVHDLTNQVLTT